MGQKKRKERKHNHLVWSQRTKQLLCESRMWHQAVWQVTVNDLSAVIWQVFILNPDSELKKKTWMNGQMAGVGWGRGWGWWCRGCCSLLKSTVKIFDIYTEESEYIQAAKGEVASSPLYEVRLAPPILNPSPRNLCNSLPFISHSCVPWSSDSCILTCHTSYY